MASVELISSTCHEDTRAVKSALGAYAARLLDAGFHRARVVVYCKCTTAAARPTEDTCDAHLPNVGREAHTWLEHLSRGLQAGSLSDVLIFANPGVIGGAHAGGIWHKAFILGQTVASIARVAKVERTLLQHTFSDGVDHPIPASLCNVPAEAGGCTGSLSPARVRNALAAENRRCRHRTTVTDDALGRVQVPTAQMPVTSYVGFCANLSTRCALCTGFRAILGCEECACEPQRSCAWNGASDRGRRALPPRLLPARPPSFAAWACKHWGISPRTIQRCRWQWTGTFAVGSGLIRQRNASLYQAAAAVMAMAGREGGVEGHFMERLWRAIFFCSLGGRCIHDIPIPTSPERYMYRGSKYRAHDWTYKVPAPKARGAPVEPFWPSPVGRTIAPRGASLALAL